MLNTLLKQELINYHVTKKVGNSVTPPTPLPPPPPSVSLSPNRKNPICA